MLRKIVLPIFFITNSLVNLHASDLETVALASQYLNQGVQEIGKVNSPCSHLVVPTTFEPSMKESSDLVMIHPIKSAEEYQSVFHEVPSPTPTESNPFYLSIIFQNDKRFLYEQLMKEKSDDTGRTHGMEIHLGLQSKDGVTKDISLKSHLMTAKIRNLVDENGNPIKFNKAGEKLQFSHYANGQGIYLDANGKVVPESEITKKPQHFQEINTLDFLADNIKSGETFYYKVGAGIVMLVSDKQTALGAATQQEKWHEMTNKTVYTNISDGVADRYGVSILGALGLQKKLEGKSIDIVGIESISYEIKGAIEAGISADTLQGNKAWGKASMGIGLGSVVRKGERFFEVNVSHEAGNSELKKLELALNGKDCSVFVVYNYYKHDKKKYAPENEGTMNFGSRCHF